MWARRYLSLTGRGRIIRSLAEVTGHGAKSGVIMCTVRPVLSPDLYPEERHGQCKGPGIQAVGCTVS